MLFDYNPERTYTVVMPHIRKWFCGTLAFLAVAPGSLRAQFFDLTVPGDGSIVYYALSADPRHDPYATTPIYEIGPATPATMVLGFTRPVFPPRPPLAQSLAYYFSPYYMTSHPQFSRDKSVFSYGASRVCLGGAGCAAPNLLQTTVRVPGKGDLKFDDALPWLSGNGRYLLRHAGGLGAGSDSVIDLSTGEEKVLPFPGKFSFGKAGRAVADNGAAAVVDIYNPFVPVYDATIDAAGKTVIYVSRDFASGRNPLQTLRLYQKTTGQESSFLQANGDCYSPAISADGKRIFFLSTAQFGTSDPPGTPQLYVINVDHTGFIELTSSVEPSGVQTFALSDDGQVVWYLSGDGALVSLNLNGTRQTFRPPAVNLAITLVPGSIAPLEMDWHDNVTATLDGVPVPRVLPWDTPTSRPQLLKVTVDGSTAQALVTPLVSAPRLVTHPIHQDWSGFVTFNSPAVPGEILYFYGTGFSPLDAAASSLPCRFYEPVGGFNETPRLLSLVLSPDAPGYYQLTIQMPNTIPWSFPFNPQVVMDCGDGVSDVIDFVQNAK